MNCRTLKSNLFRIVLGLSGLASAAGASAEIPRFETVTLDPSIGKVCYAVTVADVDHDGAPDAVALSEDALYWYRNPDWKKRLIIRDAVPTDHVCVAAHDIDDDGAVDFALGAGWPRGGGTLHWLRRSGSLDGPWQVHDIGAEPWTHRMRFADVLGSGEPQLVVTPLNATTGSGIRLLAFPIPDDPVDGSWKPIVMDGSLNRAHNHWHVDGDRGDVTETIVASSEGLTRIGRDAGGGFTAERIVDGAEGSEPSQRGAGEIKTGSFAGRPIMATIEPMHGNQVVVYQQPDDGSRWTRHVLDDSFAQGHAIWCADLDGDGNDEVIAGHRESASGPTPGPAIYLYQATNKSGTEWSRTQLDAPMACEDLCCADFNGDGKIDILAGGRATHDVKLYLQRP